MNHKSPFDITTEAETPVMPQAPRTDASSHDHKRRWGIVLAGGDGIRLRELTRLISSDDRPKQFCALLGKLTLLQEARRRAERSITADRILYSLARAHRDYYLHDLGDRPAQRIVQPSNKGTAPAILYPLLSISESDRDAIVAVLPSDHHYSREDLFTAALQSAFEVADARRDSIVLLGAHASGPEIEYGWIEPGAVTAPNPRVFHVNGFHEKPPLGMAEYLFRNGCLWNTFVMIGHVGAFLEAASAWAPRLSGVLRSVGIFGPSGHEVQIPESLYERIASTDFSREILSPGITRLVTMRLGGSGWSDLGDPRRVISTILESRMEVPTWARRWQTAARAESASLKKISTAVA